MQLGIIPEEEGWGGWLGQYQAAVKQAAERFGQLKPERANAHPSLKMREGADCSAPRHPTPLLLRAPGLTSGTKEVIVKNLKDVWDKSPELLDDIGGEQLAGSGFASEPPEVDFAMQRFGEEGEE